MVDQSIDPTKVEDPQQIKYQYEKSNFFRVIHADGVWGCINSQMGLQIAFWNERFPFPNVVEYRVSDEGTVEEQGRELPDTITREVEVSISVDLETAEVLIDWLTEKVNEIHNFLDEEAQESS
ncbi:MAG: hypothetical protein ACFB0G_11910 [Leptolyngbyaceae cyanobacterium]